MVLVNADLVLVNATMVLINADMVLVNADMVLVNANMVLVNADMVLVNADTDMANNKGFEKNAVHDGSENDDMPITLGSYCTATQCRHGPEKGDGLDQKERNPIRG